MTAVWYSLWAISTLSAVPAILIGIRKRTTLWYYAIFSLIADIIGAAAMLRAKDAAWNLNLFLLLQFCVVAWYFRESVIPKQYNKATIAGIALGAGYFVVTMLAKKHWMQTVNYDHGAILYGILMVLSIAGLYKVLQEIQVLQIERSPLFIFCAGFLLYTAGSVIYLLFEPKYHGTDMSQQLARVHRVLNILKNTLVAYSLYLYKSARY